MQLNPATNCGCCGGAATPCDCPFPLSGHATLTCTNGHSETVSYGSGIAVFTHSCNDAPGRSGQFVVTCDSTGMHFGFGSSGGLTLCGIGSGFCPSTSTCISLTAFTCSPFMAEFDLTKCTLMNGPFNYDGILESVTFTP